MLAALQVSWGPLCVLFDLCVQLLKAEEDAPMAADQEAGGGAAAAGGDAGGAAEGGEGPAPMES